MDCTKCIHEKPCRGHTDEHDYFGDCKYFEDKSSYDIVKKAFQLLIQDIDMSSVDEDIFKNIFVEIECDKKCESYKDCKDCVKEYYINKVTKDLNQKG